MSKIGLIIQREYLTRVRNKTFLLSTFLLPVTMILFIAGSVYFSISSKEERKVIAVVNDPGIFKNSLKNDSAGLSFVFASGINRVNYIDKGYDAVLDLNNDSVKMKFDIYSKKQLSAAANSLIESKLSRAFEIGQLRKKGIEPEVLDSITKKSDGLVSITNTVTSEQGKSEKIDADVNYGIGFTSGILIYITMLIFGTMVMRGVMEEKTNRIAEVIVSSVKPFELMFGKILGIAAVGLTQFFLWFVLIMLLSTAATALIPHELIEQAGNVNKSMPAGGGNALALKYMDLSHSMSNVPWVAILSSFVFYFLGGYLFYASLFAAVGSVINEDAQEAQSLMLPITMPIIFGFIILSSNLTTPDSKAMVWGSLVPFTSPIVMMGRITTGAVPGWQIALSMLLLVAGFLFTTWFAGKVYRTGILLYGKKASWKEMIRWAIRKS